MSGFIQSGRFGAAAFSTITDSFNRADSASSLGSTDTGQAWTAQTGTWGISSNTAYLASSGGDNQNTAAFDAAVSDFTLQVTFSTYAQNMGLIFRCSDTNNYLLLDTEGGGPARFLLYKRVAGSFTALSTVTGQPWATGDTLKVTCSGSAIEVFRNGVSQLTTSDSTHLTNTKVGIRQYNNSAARWNDLSLTVP